MRNRWRAQVFLSLLVFLGSVAWAQTSGVKPAPDSPPPEIPSDPLGRNSPRGTVLGFLTACRNGDYDSARRYLDTPLSGTRADTLARQLSVVLDRRLPARLNQLSARPEGSQYDPDSPDTDLVGTIESLEGTVDVIVLRKDRGKSRGIWLFSKQTLDAIPELYQDVNQVSVEQVLPAFLTQRKILNITLFGWLAPLVGMPLIYMLIGLVDRLVSPLANRIRRPRQPATTALHVLPKPVRLLLLVLVVRWTVANVNLTLLTRQFWSDIAIVITIAACVWLTFIFNGWIENRARRHLGAGSSRGGISVLRLVRRTMDLLALFASVVVALYFFDVNVSAALAGLGVGGIAVALAAQKTLENIVGGISIIADQAVRVGDVLKVGDTIGTVEEIGLRSTRIRTTDRSMVSIPNAQISNERLEDLSSRDKFWLHPVISLQYETTATQMRSVLEAIRNLLLAHAHVEADSVRVRFLRFGSSSLDIDLFAYIVVSDFDQFLEVQEELLLRIMDAVQAAGTRVALPSQTTYVAASSAFERTDLPGISHVRTRKSPPTSSLSTSPQTS